MNFLQSFIPIQSEHFMTQVSRNTETIKKTQIADKPDIPFLTLKRKAAT
ncbi:hypothetical protein LEP1GSC188_2882 [Leptospira weilii serovar Topaz str. LT2116]|uniref:Uncharacterized protein n=1 Tax=Leptospira weilii serovar Topaz str. LT2116 TaxID=1088540 RepID=M3GAB5_9LEPT|nr:hypothetical protein LEP1GSC188_2882 [Leptospira weilii serovar Topaz str. LT2116]